MSLRRTKHGLVILLGGLFLLAGCQTMSPALVSCPMPTVEQSARIQSLAPLGTPRDAAIASLKKAGIDGNFGTAKTIFYCDTWKQSDKERWHINVEILFDEQGNVYAYRPDPKSGASSTDSTAGKQKLTQPVKQVASGPKPSIADPFAE